MRSLRADGQRRRTRFLPRKYRAIQRPSLLLRTPETLQRLPGNALATGRARFVAIAEIIPVNVGDHDAVY